MNLVVGVPWWLIGLLALVLCAAAIEDVVRLRISNFTCLGVILLALAAMAIHGFPVALWQNAVIFFVILGLGTAAFAGGVLGGGDVKLLAGLGLWMNFSGAVWLIAAVFIAGGVLALFFIFSRPFRKRRREARGKGGNAGIPYGLAIAAGALMVFGAQSDVLGAKHERPNPLEFRPLNR